MQITNSYLIIYQTTELEIGSLKNKLLGEKRSHEQSKQALRGLQLYTAEIELDLETTQKRLRLEAQRTEMLRKWCEEGNQTVQE